jgi:hypothetical protein
VKFTLAGSGRAMLEIVMATHVGMTTTEFDQVVKDWIATAQHPSFQSAGWSSASRLIGSRFFRERIEST